MQTNKKYSQDDDKLQQMCSRTFINMQNNRPRPLLPVQHLQLDLKQSPSSVKLKFHGTVFRLTSSWHPRETATRMLRGKLVPWSSSLTTAFHRSDLNIKYFIWFHTFCYFLLIFDVSSVIFYCEHQMLSSSKYEQQQKCSETRGKQASPYMLMFNFSYKYMYIDLINMHVSLRDNVSISKISG